MAETRRAGKVHWFYDEVYRQNFYVLFAYKPYRLIDFARDERETDLNEPPEGMGGGCWFVDGDAYIWIGPEGLEGGLRLTGTIAHECSHAAISVLRFRGVRIDPDCDEPFCYYLEYLVRKVTALAPPKIPKKRGGGR